MTIRVTTPYTKNIPLIHYNSGKIRIRFFEPQDTHLEFLEG